MPTVHREKGYKFYFVMFDLNEPAHVHVDRQGKTAKFWLSSIKLAKIKAIVARNYVKLNPDQRKLSKVAGCLEC